MAEAGLEGMLITQGENRYYLTGFNGSAGTVVITATRQLLIVDFRYWEQAATEAPDFEVVRLQGRLEDRLPEIFAELGINQVGFEANAVTVAQLDRWREKLGSSLILRSTTDWVEQHRRQKDKSEVVAIRRAAALTDQAFKHICLTIRPGMTERQIAWGLEVYLRTHGADSLAFDTIVASGPNAALPHAKSGDRPVQTGEPILLDFGARVDHYCADLSRTICLGKPPKQLAEIHELVRLAQQTALDGIRAGLTTREADAIARDVIQDAGYGEQFGHGLGHGVGLAIHEGPRVSWMTDEVLAANMVITVEPGIYVPNWGGVRIEDTVVVQDDGVESLSQASKTLTIT